MKQVLLHPRSGRVTVEDTPAPVATPGRVLVAADVSVDRGTTRVQLKATRALHGIANGWFARPSVSVPLASTRPEAVRPSIAPLRWYALGEQVTATPLTSLVPIVPEPLPTLQVAPDGCACTATA